MAVRKVIFADNLEVLSSMPDEGVDLIYVDPPFNTGRVQERRSLKTVRDEDGGDRVGFQGKRYRTVEVGSTAYPDAFDDYLSFLEPRFREARRVLKSNGSFFLHVDYREVHYCKVLLDEVFGRESFINEIVWAYDYGGRSKSRWPAKHDNILWYAKDPEDYTFNYEVVDRIPYMAPGLVSPEKAARGKTPTDVWWHTIVPTNGKEKTGYPTQKPLGIIERIVRVHSNQGDVVLDFFAGSGTTGEAAAKLGRGFILVDDNAEAIRVMEERLAGYDVELEGCRNMFVGTYIEQEVILTVNHHAQGNDMDLLERLADSLHENYPDIEDPIWSNSSFAWIRERSPSQMGSICKQLIAGFLNQRGFDVSRAPGRGADWQIDGIRAAVKSSTLWEGGSYKFQQLRDQNYRIAICLGISPFNAHCWVIPKDFIMANWGDPEYFPIQHSGREGVDTVWLTVDLENVQPWLSQFGGTLSEAAQVLSELPSDT